MTTALIVCEWFDTRGYGLSLAALAFSRNLPAEVDWHPVVCHPPSGQEATPHPCLYQPGTILDRLLKAPRALLPAIDQFRPGIVHLHGIWTGAVRLIPAMRSRGVRVVISPHGMCEPYILARNRGRKAILNLWFHRRCLRAADLIHALNAHEAECVRAYLGKRCPPIEIIPNGVDAPVSALPQRDSGPRTFLFCGRLDPKKNIDGLLDAWQASGVAADGHRLDIAGDASGAYADQIKARAQQTAGVRLLGAVQGERKDTAFRAAHIGILASHSEGLPMAILESLAYGMPCVITTGCRMPEVSAGLGWSVPQAELAVSIRAAANMPAETYAAVSVQAAAYARRHHDWPINGRKLAEAYGRAATQLKS